MNRSLFLFLFLALGGCASLGIRDSTLELQITPLPLLRGKPAMARLNAPLDATSVVGTVLVMGSPQLQFRKDPEGGQWYFYGTIPFSPWVKPGTYTVRALVNPAQGKPRYTEMKVEIQ